MLLIFLRLSNPSSNHENQISESENWNYFSNLDNFFDKKVLHTKSSEKLQPNDFSCQKQLKTIKTQFGNTNQANLSILLDNSEVSARLLTEEARVSAILDLGEPRVAWGRG